MTTAFPEGPQGSVPAGKLFPRVLIVDDDRLTLAVMRDTARGLGLQVETATSLTDARQQLASASFDLLLLDVYLPDGTGMDLVAASGFDTPCIVISSRAETEVGARAIEAGALDFLAKPFDGHELGIRLALAAERLRLRTFERRMRAELEVAVQDRTRNLHDALQRVEQLYRETTDLLASALEARDAETHHHSMRVATYSVHLARELGIGGESLRQVEWGALLHDVGKIAVPDHVLRKTGPLSAEERAIINQHPEVGYRMVRKVGFLNEAADMVLAHQERLDGSGYPRGLRGEAIPLSARIFGVADTVDAITSDRPYRAAQSFAVARTELLKEAGRTLDPLVVEAYAKVPDEEWAAVRSRAEVRARQSGIAGEFLRI